MFNFGFSKRTVAKCQALASLLLIILAFVFSLTPIFSIDTTAVGYGEDGGTMKEAIAESVSAYTDKELSSDEIEEKIAISPIRLLRVIVLYGKVITRNISYTDVVKQEIDEWVGSESGRQDIIIVSAISEMMQSMGRRAGGNESGLSIIFNIVLAFLGFITVPIMTFVIPIILFFKALSALLAFLKRRRSPEEVSGRLGASLPPFVTVMLFYMIVQSICQGFAVGWGSVVILSLCLCSALVNAVASRQMSLSSGLCAYANSVQGAAIVSVVGFLIYFFNIISAGVLGAFADGSYSEYTAKIASITANDPSAVVHSEYMVDGIMMIAYVLLGAISILYLERAIRRVSFGGAKKEINPVLCIMTLAACLIPIIISGMLHYFNDPRALSEIGDASFLPRDSFDYGALVAATVGAGMMILGDVCSAVLSGIFAGEVSQSEKRHLLLGGAMRDYMMPKPTAENTEEHAEAEEDTGSMASNEGE